MEEDSSSPELDLFQKELVLRRICRVLPRHHPLCTLPNLLAAAARDQYGDEVLTVSALAALEVSRDEALP